MSLKNNIPSLKGRAAWTRVIVCSLLILTTAADFITFVINPKYWDFDMSPMVVMTKNIFIISLVKFGVVFGLCYMLLKAKTNDYFRFLWIMCGVYLILFQALGTMSNRQVAAQAPPPEAAPPKEVRVQTAINISFLYAYYPIIFSMLSFWIWNWGWRL